ncbi:MAG: hypothetical protein HY721_22795 [Planctomycetes bacterium]|nr:hypothetical protein [Planctomycetota bacterium]
MSRVSVASGARGSARLGRFPFLVAGVLCLAAGIWGGLARLQWGLPLPASAASWISFHGPLMVSGFLGTLIGLERAVAMGRAWAYLGPLLSAAGGLVLASGASERTGQVLLAAAGLSLVAVFGAFLRHERALHTAAMGAGAASWLAGSLLWLSGWPIAQVVFWWAGFLLLTIAGERIELARLRRPSRWERPLFLASAALFLSGLALSVAAPARGERTAGLGMLAFALWLLRFDVARRTVRQAGLPRFVAVALLSGYVWLLAAGVLAAALPPWEHKQAYGAVLHGVFLGFAMAMVFGHAPIVFPAVLGVPIPFRRAFYAHLAVLQASVALRAAGDLGGWLPVSQWGGLLGAVALALFFATTAITAASAAMGGRASTRSA